MKKIGNKLVDISDDDSDENIDEFINKVKNMQGPATT